MKKAEKTLTKYMNSLADFIGKPKVFIAAILLVTSWFMVRFFMEYQIWFDTMDMAIFVSTFFLLFVVQSSQNADTKAIQDKLDEIIDSLPGADNSKEKEEERLKQGETK